MCCKLWLCVDEFSVETVLSRGFPYLRDLMAAMISFFSGGAALTSRSVSESCSSASIFDCVLFRTSLKYSAHLASSLCCLFKIGVSVARRYLPLTTFVSLFSSIGGLSYLTCQVFHVGRLICPCHPPHCPVFFSVLLPASFFQLL